MFRRIHFAISLFRVFAIQSVPCGEVVMKRIRDWFVFLIVLAIFAALVCLWALTYAPGPKDDRVFRDWK